jgi:hypothetical protein
MPESSITEKAMFGVPWITGKREPSGYSGRIPEGPWKAVINDYPLSADLLEIPTEGLVSKPLSLEHLVDDLSVTRVDPLTEKATKIQCEISYYVFMQ